MSKLPDPWLEGLRNGWHVLGHTAAPPRELQCDVLVIGTGAGGGISAELLARAGFSVILLEEGPLKTSTDFNQLEREAYPSLYQESAARKTADKAINILQGRCVGGSTTVNWTSSFRTPADTLAFWRDRLGLTHLTDGVLEPYFAQAERRLHIAPWTVAPNENNSLLQRGALRLGIATDGIRRNVHGCWNLGSCGLGCPTNAKQSMLLAGVPAALAKGATLVVNCRAQRLLASGDAVQGVEAVFDGEKSASPLDLKEKFAIKISASHVVLAGGAINSPALLLRSGAPDPHSVLGHRTFLHPVVLAAAQYSQRVEGWAGAPQTVYTDHFLHTQAIDGPMGYKLEAPPIYPVIFASSIPGMGAGQGDLLRTYPHQHILLALLRDGFAPASQGGRVSLRGDGSPVLDYPLNDFVMEGARRALLSMAEIQFAAGASSVLPVHEHAVPYRSWAQAREAIAALPMLPYRTRVVSAHVMGGCALSATPERGVVNPQGQHWQWRNLSVHDGSLFPTSVGANPQLSIYGLVNMLTQELIQRLGGRAEPLA